MGLLDLVEENQTQRLLPDLLSQAGDTAPNLRHPGGGTGGHVLAHVEADHPVLVAEQVAGELFGQLSLANAGGANEEHRPAGTLRIVEPCLEAGQHPGCHQAGLILADHLTTQCSGVNFGPCR